MPAVQQLMRRPTLFLSSDTRRRIRPPKGPGSPAGKPPVDRMPDSRTPVEEPESDRPDTLRTPGADSGPQGDPTIPDRSQPPIRRDPPRPGRQADDPMVPEPRSMRDSTFTAISG
jgi:hypothetical protein